MRMTAVAIGVLIPTMIGCGSNKTPSTGGGSKRPDDKQEHPSLVVSFIGDKKILRFTHIGPMGTDNIDVDVGFSGDATSVTDPHYNVAIKTSWTSPKECELSIDYDSKNSSRTMTVSTKGFANAKAVRDGVSNDPPFVLPAGKQKLSVKATCP